MTRLVWLAVLFVIAVVSGCAQMHNNEDHQRHSMSRISQPLNGGDFLWFDVKVTPQLPLDNEAAEQQRQIWLQSWLVRRNMCPDGYEIVERRPFEFLEHNPARLDIRYKVKCIVVAPG